MDIKIKTNLVFYFKIQKILIIVRIIKLKKIQQQVPKIAKLRLMSKNNQTIPPQSITKNFQNCKNE